MKKQIHIVAVILLLVVGFALYFTMHRSTGVRENATKKVSFAEFLKTNTGSYACSVQYPFQTGTITATLHLADGMIRGDYVSPYENVNVMFIIRDGYYYPWTSLATSSFKIPMPRDAAGNQTGEVYRSYVETAQEYTCSPWITDASMFVLPKNILFKSVE
ncbi:MAG: hypothetical protein KBC21_04475 [Candidatus Pacebacteria bacterium]|nr:hypothetical protein [Candidatus Paceibacterota bacterium]